MSDLGQILISISNKLSKLISRTNKLERNIYKIAKFYIPVSTTAGDLPDVQFDTNSVTPSIYPCPDLRQKSDFMINKIDMISFPILPKFCTTSLTL